ncbi:MAG: hypothetical protein PHS53_01255 [Candidatus Pacebacteria bacterium]|nr:hypothetical protein [Candidatus Paceibacterota bacterium]MDD5356760.1 hypothetical protein [Candidatus Paceibacterota bacterium]
MSINDIPLKIKTLDSSTKERIFVVILIILVGSASFGLGRLSISEGEKTPIRIENFTSSTSEVVAAGQGSELSASMVLASKTGTAYYYPTCSGANRIAEKNKITFPSAKEAEAFGLHIGPGCKIP